MAWILHIKHAIANLVHYLEDFFTCGAANTDECVRNIERIIKVFENLGVPLAVYKLIGPVTVIIYLGIEIDSDDMVIRLPAEKLSELLDLLNVWHDHKKCTKRELLSLIGKLSFAAKVVQPGRIFLRRLIDLSTTVRELHHHISITRESRRDIEWWREFLPTWNAQSVIPELGWTASPDLELYTDASTVGYGAVYQTHWFTGKWPEPVTLNSIPWKELFTIYAACFVWGPAWKGKKVLLHTDNEAATFLWDRKSSKCPHLMQLVRKLYLVAARNEFSVALEHISGSSNKMADLLSRLQVDAFRQMLPNAKQSPTELPPEVWDI